MSKSIAELNCRLMSLEEEQHNYELSLIKKDSQKAKAAQLKQRNNSGGLPIVIVLHCDVLHHERMDAADLDTPTILYMLEHIVKAFGESQTPLTLAANGYTVEVLQKNRPGLIEYLPRVPNIISLANTLYTPMAASLYPTEVSTSAKYDFYAKIDASLQLSNLGYLPQYESVELLLPGLRQLGWHALLVPRSACNNSREIHSSGNDDAFLCPVSEDLSHLLHKVMRDEMSAEDAAAKLPVLPSKSPLFIPLNICDFTDGYYPEEARRLLCLLGPQQGHVRCVAFSEDLLPSAPCGAVKRFPPSDIICRTYLGRDTLYVMDRLRVVAPQTLSRYRRRLWQMAAQIAHATNPTEKTTLLVSALLSVLEGPPTDNIDTFLFASSIADAAARLPRALEEELRLVHETLSRYSQEPHNV